MAIITPNISGMSNNGNYTVVRPVTFGSVRSVSINADSAEFSGKNRKKSGRFKKLAGAVIAVIIGLAVLFRDRISKFFRSETKKNDTARKAYNVTLEKLNKKTEFSPEKPDKIIAPKEKPGAGAKDDMKKSHTDLEKTSGAKQSGETGEKFVYNEAEHRSRLFRPEDKQLDVTGKKFTSEERIAVCSYQDNYLYNSALRNKEITDPSKINEIKTMDEIIKNAPETVDDAVLYRGISTKNFKGEDTEFAKQIKVGAIIEDPSFVSTARKQGRLIDDFNPVTNALEPEKPVGYMMRIKLPKGSKVIDCGRGGMYPDEVILPRNSKIKINAIDEKNHILECEYLL